jgi:hypothetical protein
VLKVLQLIHQVVVAVGCQSVAVAAHLSGSLPVGCSSLLPVVAYVPKSQLRLMFLFLKSTGQNALLECALTGWVP